MVISWVMGIGSIYAGAPITENLQKLSKRTDNIFVWEVLDLKEIWCKMKINTENSFKYCEMEISIELSKILKWDLLAWDELILTTVEFSDQAMLAPTVCNFPDIKKWGNYVFLPDEKNNISSCNWSTWRVHSQAVYSVCKSIWICTISNPLSRAKVIFYSIVWILLFWLLYLVKKTWERKKQSI